MSAIFPKPRERLHFLDSLRGLAAIYVLLFHASIIPKGYALHLPWWAEATVKFGGSGVTLFFVVSSFSLCLTMPRHLSRSNPLFSFYASRFFQVAPLFYCMLVVSVLMQGLAFGAWRSLANIAASITFIFNFIPGWDQGIVWASWTIGVEVPFYVLFPILYFRLKSVGTQIFLLAILLVVSMSFPTVIRIFMPSINGESFFNHSIIKHFPIFIIGMLGFHAWLKLKYQKSKADIGLILMACGLLGLATIIGGAWRYSPAGIYYWQGLFYGSILVGAGLSSPLLLELRPLRYLGRISYSIYLLHAPIVFWLGPVYKQVDVFLGPSLAFCVNAAISIAIVVCAASITYYAIELTFENFGKRLVKRQGIQPVGSADSTPA